jgi:AraC family transcriptional regulator of adaptative response/methylated-DNA-[protein]-cysteine methyltransferase
VVHIPLTDDERWQAVQNRDSRYDGQFVTAVRTTGIYCRPSCAARPHRRNVTFYDTPQQAEAAGFRACKRCKPDQAGAASVSHGKGGKGMTIRFMIEASSPGYVLVGATERGLCSVMLGDSPAALIEVLHDEYPAARIEPAADVRQAASAVLRSLSGDPARIDLPLDVRATPFQQQVWDALRRIPYGETRTYSQIAREIGRPDAVRAVASACAANQVALVIPCHRVIREDGTLGGFRWGLERKRALLDQERAGTSSSPVPAPGQAYPVTTN